MAEYTQLSLKDLMIRVDEILRNTYSIKYLGLNKNEMGIISRRINPLSDQHFKIHDNIQECFSVNKYFYPKPLKTGKKIHHCEKINVENLESEIKKEFEDNMADSEEKKMKKNIVHERLRSTKMSGSWCSLAKGKKKDGDIENKKEVRYSANELAKSIEMTNEQKKSFSRFLSQGILVIRD